ncbi:MAG: hypothetical protein GY898_24765 [Proteobacteria bacterium]|nr:hypothetical protein [Pseudomonadota bacterium]
MGREATGIVLAAGLLAACGRPAPPPECGSEDFACFFGAFSNLGGTAIEGMELCTPDLPEVDCVATNADGTFQLPGLPLETDVAITAEHADFVPTLFPQNTALDWYAWNKVAVPPFVVETHADRLDSELDPELGHLLFLVWEGLNLDGVDTPRVTDVEGELLAPDGSLFYADGLGLASASATATTSSGSGGALNLAPGTAELVLTAPEGPCDEASFTWALEDDGTIPVPVRAGFFSAIDIVCPVP